jgi:redox-sensitive bicupin YhaK (pirin superfamily)
MFTPRRASERQHCQRRTQEDWLTFDPQSRTDPLAHGFGPLELLNEIRIAPGTPILRKAHHDVDILTYIYQGALSYSDSTSQRGRLQAGEFHRVTLGQSPAHSNMSVSPTGWVHVYELWLHPSTTDLPSEEAQRRFSMAERRGRLCVVASPDARQGSLRIREDALIYSAVLAPGQHMARELHSGRSAWLHVVRGAIAVSDLVLTAGDGAGVSEERSLSFVAQERSEILLVDLAGSSATDPTCSGRD